MPISGEHPFAPALSDYVWSLAAAGVFTAVYLVEKRFVLAPLGRALVASGQPRSVAKFCDAAWKLQNWLPLCALGLAISSSHSWFFNGPELWRHYPNPMTFWIRAYYLIELGWYMHAQLALMVFEDDTGKKRSDFWPMTVHHATTIALISFSFFQGYTPVGCMIMWVHDIVDIFLESALLFKELEWQRTCDALFSLFAVSWGVFRLGIFPFHLVLSIERDLPSSCPRVPGATTATFTRMHELWAAWAQGKPVREHYLCPWVSTFLVMLAVLVVLHVYWGYLIARMVVRFVFDKKVVGDIRDDEVDGRVSNAARATTSVDCKPTHSAVPRRRRD